SGTGSYSDFFDLVALGLDFSVGVDGILRLEFFEEGFDDIPGADGIWNFGTLTFGVEPAAAEVPEPSTTLLLGAGLAMLG
ncbi:PEP-CTERM sorting domain-containing protein, partial [Acinetobacter baumannii]|uniref:PEP-CTERM sorting domain-containing protein n=1 Tax=Acinetobacter baumannii TaxID=470 RepID=UPI0028912BF9